ncbi:nucleoporin SEH1 [Ceratobasidium sp. AG-Ba]|nr:nucleoporin SEH1 [Ceratobasidium sp. AG-Ba]QRW10674.1 nucleoporin SEH1 [Ceratobasidium sp. AG-Ba]
MLQSSVIPSTHADLITDTAYDYHGLKLATAGIDQKIKIWKLNELSGVWSMIDEWKAHDAPVAKIAWAHPEFGTLIASCSYDRTVKIWEDARSAPDGAGSSRFQLRTTLTEARGTVRAVDFAPAAFGLKLVTIASDNFVRIYECHETYHLTAWSLAEEFDAAAISLPLSAGESPNSGATPTQTHATLSDTPPLAPSGISLQRTGTAPSALIASTSGNPLTKPVGVKEADGAWCVSWLKDRFTVPGEIIAVSCGTQAIVKIIALQPSKPPQALLVIPQHPANTQSSLLGTATPTSTSPSLLPAVPHAAPSHPVHAITCLAWAPPCGRSYHLLATGSRDHKVRIFKLWQGERDGFGDEDAGKGDLAWSFSRLGEFDDHKASVGRVEWNITGTILSSAGDDGKIRLWKATFNNVWRSMGTLGAVESEGGDAMEQ